MLLTDLSVKRPVFASVISLLLVAFGLVAFTKIPLREYPEIDPPIVSISTDYRGASAVVVERRITKLIEDRIAGIEGLKNISSQSSDGRSEISIEFQLSRDLDSASNDVRERISRLLNRLPEEASPPEISKAGSEDETIMWFNLVSDRMNNLELTDYARRYLVDRFSTVNGVARVRVGGGKDYSMRIWLDRESLAARGITVNDVEAALLKQNIELPAGFVESDTRQFTVRVQRVFNTADSFSKLVIAQGSDGHLIRLEDVARVEVGPKEQRNSFRGNGIPMVGVGITKQSTANTLEVARGARALGEAIQSTLPEGMELINSYDSSVFIERAIAEVYQTLAIALSVVVLVIYLFLGNVRSVIIPAITVPVSLLSTFVVLFTLGFTINILTLLALILAVGMVVDDAIVMLENIHRRIEMGEKPLLAAFVGARQVSFAIVATTLVLLSVFLPITFLEGDLGKLFTEFAVTMSAAVAFSSLLALTLSPMLCSKFLTDHDSEGRLTQFIDRVIEAFQKRYRTFLQGAIAAPRNTLILVGAAALGSALLLQQIPGEFAPREDRGAFFIIVSGPEGSSFKYSHEYMLEIERRLMPLVENGEVSRLLMRTPRGFGVTSDFSGGFGILVLEDWAQRRSAWEIINDVRGRLEDLSGVRAFPVMRQALGRGVSKPVQFVIGGPDYQTLAQWREILAERVRENSGLVGVDFDYKETKPQLRVIVDVDRAGDLGVSNQTIGRSLETMLGSRLVTTYQERGEEYDVILEGFREDSNTPADLTNIYVRSDSSAELIPLSNLVSVEEFADAGQLNRYNRMRAITLEANLADGYTLGEALNYLNEVSRELLPVEAIISYKGQSQDLRTTSSQVELIFALALLVVFLVLAAQFESYIHPLVIMLTVPLAIFGALLGLYMFGQTLNIYSQIGIIMLVGLAAKNGILIVEFANQLRDQGMDFEAALLEAAKQRLRPILMTGLTTALGALPLILTSGAGSETRITIGVVILTGIAIATVFTLVIVPVAYALIARHTSSPQAVSRELEKLVPTHHEQEE